MRTFTPTGAAPRSASSSSREATAGAGTIAVATIPMPPAPVIAATSSGVPTPPMGASWIGTEQPTISVKRVRGTRAG